MKRRRWVGERISSYDQQAIVRRFLEQRGELEQLTSEVAFLLKHRMQAKGIEVAHVVSRVKSLPSLLEKIKRKSYQYPLDEITDLAGVRVVCLYPYQLQLIADVVKDTFVVDEQVSKTPKALDAFGYEALHHVVRLRPESSGARYALFGNHRCEIQIRTVLQDAWAIIDHHLRYKTEDQVPRRIRRDLYALAAVLQNADRQFESVATDRDKYFKRLAHPRTSLATLLREETNSQSVAAYLRRKFPKLPLASYPGHLEVILEPLNFERYPTLADIDNVVEQTAVARRKYRGKGAQRNAVAQLGLALAALDVRYRRKMAFSEAARKVFDAIEAGRKPKGKKR
jgi:Uncharacterized protein conserved in bacteria